MIVSLVAGRPASGALVNALSSLGWEGALTRASAAGMEPLTFEIVGIGEPAQEALLRVAPKYALEVLTGPDRAVLLGTRARFSALCSRPWNLPEHAVAAAVALGQALPAEEPAVWRVAGRSLPLDRPILMGILNLTPDSFSDGGRYPTVEDAVVAARALLEAGATILDLGGESTRPGRPTPVPIDEEIHRVVPVLERLVSLFPEALLSIDTVKAAVARAAVTVGAVIINDVSGGRLDPEIFDVARDSGAGLVLMHSRGSTTDMASYAHAHYPGGVAAEVRDELTDRVAEAVGRGVPAETIVVDPGFGFGKTPEQAIELLRGLGTLRALGRPILVGPSRKRFVGELTGQPVEARDIGSAAVCAHCWLSGARIFRVHDPNAARDVLSVMNGIEPTL